MFCPASYSPLVRFMLFACPNQLRRHSLERTNSIPTTCDSSSARSNPEPATRRLNCTWADTPR
eukprot:7208985-Pyramimonas_sp.AAC.1